MKRAAISSPDLFYASSSGGNEALRVTGIGGEATALHGLDSLFDLDRLAVFGFVEPLKRLPELLSIRSAVRQHMLTERPDVFLGVDSPDFNLTLEQQLRARGLKTAHLVSPSVWAWRPGRIKRSKSGRPNALLAAV